MPSRRNRTGEATVDDRRRRASSSPRAFQAELAAAATGGGPFAVLMLDLDGFKAFNDRHGHAAGDGLLRRVAESLAAGVRAAEGDRVYRYGGDEFAAILPDVGAADAQAIAKRLASLVAGDRANRGVTISFGVAASPGDASAKDELVMAADSRLYAATAARHRRDSRAGRAAVGRGRARAAPGPGPGRLRPAVPAPRAEPARMTRAPRYRNPAPRRPDGCRLAGDAQRRPLPPKSRSSMKNRLMKSR